MTFQPLSKFKPFTLGLIAIPLLLSACANTPDRRGPDTRDRSANSSGERPNNGRARNSGTFARPLALLFADMDANGDKRLSLAELEAGAEKEWESFDRAPSAIFFANWSRNALGSTDASPTFMMFDKDLNGVVSKAEFMTLLAERFTRYDTDKNELVDRSELIVAFEAQRGQRSGGNDQGGGRGGQRGGGGRPPR